MLTVGERTAIAAALRQIEESHLDQQCPPSEAEDLHTWIEQQVVARAGEAGRKLHTARSRNDQVATLLKLYVLDAAERIGGRLTQLIETCCQKARDWAELVAPLHTHAQFAAPGTLGFWALRYAVGFERVWQTLGQARAQWEQHCPLGSAAVAGSSVPIDRQIQAAGLAFREPSLNALDSTSTRDECLQLLALLAQLGLHFQSFAVDVITFAQTPYGWVVYPPAFGTGSSMMPNKANPDAMELLRGRCAALQAAYVELLLLLKGLPSGYNRDLQCCKPLVHRAVDEALLLSELLTAFLAELEFDEGRLQEALSQGHIAATLAMEQRVCEGVPLRDAHHAVADALDSTTATPRDVHRYQTSGSAHPDETRRVAERLLARVRGGNT